MNSDKKTNYIIKIASLSALAGVLMMFKFPIPIAPSFYKLEFSDISALLGGFALGPLAAILINLIKNIINILMEGTTTAYIGEFSNFLMSCSLSVVAALIYKKDHSKKGAVKALIIASIFMPIMAGIVNYFILIPAYVRFMNFPLEAIISLGTKIYPIITSKFLLVLLCTIPFNIIKCVLVSTVTFIIYKKVSPLLHK